MTATLQGTRLDLTDDVRRRVAATLAAALRPLGGDTSAVHAAVEVERTSRGLHRAEVTLPLGRATLRAEATAATLREALGDVRQTLARQVREWRARRRDAQRAAPPVPPETGDPAWWDATEGA